MLALKRDAQQSHKSVIIVDSPIFNCTVSICALFPTLIFSFQLAGFVSAQIKKKTPTKENDQDALSFIYALIKKNLTNNTC